MAWDKSKVFLEKVQLGSIVLYLICLGGYTINSEDSATEQSNDSYTLEYSHANAGPPP